MSWNFASNTRKIAEYLAMESKLLYMAVVSLGVYLQMGTQYVELFVLEIEPSQDGVYPDAQTKPMY